jgi:predicted RNA binding protein YcfA (HicA-like mRNA interferase family)
MKRRQLIKTIEKCGCILIRHGGNHDWYRNPEAGIYREIKDILARHIIRMLCGT